MNRVFGESLDYEDMNVYLENGRITAYEEDFIEFPFEDLFKHIQIQGISENDTPQEVHHKLCALSKSRYETVMDLLVANHIEKEDLFELIEDFKKNIFPKNSFFGWVKEQHCYPIFFENANLINCADLATILAAKNKDEYLDSHQYPLLFEGYLFLDIFFETFDTSWDLVDHIQQQNVLIKTLTPGRWITVFEYQLNWMLESNRIDKVFQRAENLN